MKYRFLRFPGGKTKAVTFSYDDGCREDLKTVQVLDKYGMKGTFNINTAGVLNDTMGFHMTEDEIRKNIVEKGHEVAVHGQWHKAPGLVRAIDGIQDILNGRMDLERMFDRIIRGMAYPDSGILCFLNQTTYEDVRRYAKDLDIVYARTLGYDNDQFELPTDWLNWKPTAHHDNPNVLEWAKAFVEMDVNKEYFSSRRPKLFYVWGHSFEFERNNNWERLESICETLANKDDIWYETNMEIYEYITAFESLVYSADGKKVHNPTLKELWIDDNDGTLHSIKPGETIGL